MKPMIPLLTALLCTALTASVALPVATAVPTVATDHRNTIRWHQCQLGPDDDAGKELDRAGAECGDLAVPLDYSRPNGPSITVAISRLKATDRARRIGTMVLNDGGPGGPGLDMPLRVASRRPLTIGKHQLDDTTVPGLLMSVLGDDRDQSRARVAGIVQTLVKATNGPVEPSEALAEHLKFMLTGEASQTASAQLAIMCGDRAAPRDIEGYWRDIQEHRKTQPYFGALAYNLSPCVFWPEPPREVPTRVDNAVPALLIAADGDPRAVYSGALVLHKSLTASKLLTLKNARTHGVYGEYGNTCVDNKVNTYLATGTLPPTNLTC